MPKTDIQLTSYYDIKPKCQQVCMYRNFPSLLHTHASQTSVDDNALQPKLAEFIHPKWINMPEINIAITELNLSICDDYKGFDD